MNRCWECDQLYLLSYEAIVPNKHHEPDEGDFACYCNDKVTWYAETSEASGSDNSGNAIAQHVDLVVEGQGLCQVCHHLELDLQQEEIDSREEREILDEIDNRRALGHWAPLEMLADMGRATVTPEGRLILEVGRHLMQDFLKGSIVPEDENDFYVLIAHNAADINDLAKYLIDSDKGKPWWTTIDDGRFWVSQDARAIGDVQLELTPQRVREECESESEESGDDEQIKDDEDDEELDDDEQFGGGEQDDNGNVYHGNVYSNTEYQQYSRRLP